MSRTVYNTKDEPVRYTWVDRLFGPNVTEHDLLNLEFRAFNEGWSAWFDMILQVKSRKKRLWLLAYLRDEVIRVEVHERDVYDDDDPWEGIGEH